LYGAYMMSGFNASHQPTLLQIIKVKTGGSSWTQVLGYFGSDKA